MKKFVFGLILGAGLALSGVALAAGGVQAVLFPVKFVFNGLEKKPDTGDAAINYNGHVYVPIRFIGETMKSTVNYDEKNRTITVHHTTDEGFPLRDPYVDFIGIGNLKLVKTVDQTKVTGQIKLEETFYSKEDNPARIGLTFLDEELKSIGDVQLETTIDAGEIQTFEVIVKGDLSTYKHVTVSVPYVADPTHKITPPPDNFPIIDPNHANTEIMIEDIFEFDGFSRIYALIQVKKPGKHNIIGTLIFKNEAGFVIGEASVQTSIEGWSGTISRVNSFETWGKGRLSEYSHVEFVSAQSLSE